MLAENGLPLPSGLGGTLENRFRQLSVGQPMPLLRTTPQQREVDSAAAEVEVIGTGAAEGPLL